MRAKGPGNHRVMPKPAYTVTQTGKESERQNSPKPKELTPHPQPAQGHLSVELPEPRLSE